MEACARTIKLAGDQTPGDPLTLSLIPSWSRVLSVLPDGFHQLLAAAERDNA